ncbi:hypothetical protein E6R18_25000 [Streptomyces sp. A1277]|uniref:hypothetical protein n=1 Tax=Streptomyces sp. A1277 TaxID=2563103 RepID=UPI0010A21FD7|nr:hypothetical protein [Streptomyces sp. A1277]THA29172.1 hypothetical protein E6R18_25000 [Streptomyces sp. A1277]
MSTENPEIPVIEYEPATYYNVTAVCRTEGCANYDKIAAAPVYSNNGNPDYVNVIDSTCRSRMVILTATKMDPQPPEE